MFDSMVQDLLSYFWALWGYARWLLAGGPFFVDAILKRAFPAASAWIDKRIHPTTRVRIEVALLFFAVFSAGFFSWRDEHQRVRQTNLPIKNPDRPWLAVDGVSKVGDFMVFPDFVPVFMFWVRVRVTGKEPAENVAGVGWFLPVIGGAADPKTLLELQKKRCDAAAQAPVREKPLSPDKSPKLWSSQPATLDSLTCTTDSA
jgi:hypothetical protein